MNRTGHRGKVDSNHTLVIGALRKAGIAAKSTAMIGDGFPDIIAAMRGVQVLLEVKREGEKLTRLEQAFAETWPGPVFVVTDGDQAVRVVVEAARPR